MSAVRGAVAAALLLLGNTQLVGCQEQLMATPNLYVGRSDDPFAHVPGPLRTSTVDVLYVTDRKRGHDSAVGAHYGHERGDELVFGSARVSIGRDVSWDELVEASRMRQRRGPLPVTVTSVREEGRLEGDGESLRARITARMAASDIKEAVIFVHGFNTTLEQGAEVVAQLWHFAARRGVPIAYSWPSWPAGQGGLRSYAYDYESSAYTVGHFKRLVEAIAACDEVRRVHVLAHSRGADTVLTAIRELLLARGGDAPGARSSLKLGAVVLAAPDMDTALCRERVLEEGLDEVPQCLVVYCSPDDWALDLAGWLLGDSKRLGRAEPAELGALAQGTGLQLIQAKVTGYTRNQHDYFYRHPAVSSDLLLVLAGHFLPGSEHGRPLAPVAAGVWRITNDYVLPLSPNAAP